MQPIKTAKAAAKVGWDTIEDIGTKTAKPFGDEMYKQFDSLFGSPFGSKPKELAQEDLKRAREEEKIKKMKEEEAKKDKAYYAAVQNEYRSFEQKQNKEQKALQEEVGQLQSEVVQLAKAAGVETNVHMERMPKKVGILDIRRLTAIVRTLRLKADEAKSGSELVSQRQNAKSGTGMMAWVSGKQMKIHEQGTLQLQG